MELVKYSFDLILVFFLSISVLTYAQDFLPCNTEWVAHNMGDPLPEHAVPVFGNSKYVARIDSGGHTYHGATMDTKIGKAFGEFKNRNFPTYDILTNPSKCKVKWVSQSEADRLGKDFRVKVSPTSSYFIGRREIGNEWESGCGFNGKVYLHGGSSSSYQVLISQSAGFKLELSNFEFTSTPFDNEAMDFLGLDVIYNKSPAEATQTVTHTKSVTESTSFTEENSFSHTAGVSVSAGFWGVSVEASYSFTSSSSSSKTVSQEKTNEVSVSRQLTVPALTSIQACSTIRTAENFVIGYKARGRFTLDGYSGQEVATALRKYTKYQVTEGETDPVAAVATLTGIFRGTLAMSTEFIILPSDSVTGCDELQKAIETAKHERLMNTTSVATLDPNQKVERILKQMKGIQDKIKF